ncbi:MAG TPA: hypothetical protein DEU95_13855 [Chloroflexi bacterium]|jgi:hypothetical protein|nr:hypothetical protein [Chloroflexota bacterium]
MKIFPEHWPTGAKAVVFGVVLVVVIYALSKSGSDSNSARDTPTLTPTKQSAKTYTVQYILKTSTAQNVRVVYNNATEGMERRENMSLSAFHPTEWSYQMEPGTHAYISVDTSQKTPQSVSVSCELLVNGVRKDYTEAKGPLASVTCSGIVGR